jgi:ArsR family transcriptional regulator
MASLDEVLTGLRAAAEPTRLRLLALCAQGDLTVTELTQILGQSQPRVSRHLKLLVEAGLLDRFREGTWAFYRLAESGSGAELARRTLGLLPADDPTLRLDLSRLNAIKRERAETAEAYFRANAEHWGSIRSLHVDETEVERALLDVVASGPHRDLLDLGTGTGRILEVLGPLVERGLGLDSSREMLAMARTNLEQAGLRHCHVRQADIYQLPLGDAGFDLVTIHQVLHFAERPGAVVAEAARVLRPGGRLVVVDFAPHDREELRDAHSHRRLGFADAEVQSWFRTAGLIPAAAHHLPGAPLTVVLWQATRPVVTESAGAVA